MLLEKFAEVLRYVRLCCVGEGRFEFVERHVGFDVIVVRTVRDGMEIVFRHGISVNRTKSGSQFIGRNIGIHIVVTDIAAAVHFRVVIEAENGDALNGCEVVAGGICAVGIDEGVPWIVFSGKSRKLSGFMGKPPWDFWKK